MLPTRPRWRSPLPLDREAKGVNGMSNSRANVAMPVPTGAVLGQQSRRRSFFLFLQVLLLAHECFSLGYISSHGGSRDARSSRLGPKDVAADRRPVVRLALQCEKCGVWLSDPSSSLSRFLGFCCSS